MFIPKRKKNCLESWYKYHYSYMIKMLHIFCCVQVWVIGPTSNRKVKVEYFISERTRLKVLDKSVVFLSLVWLLVRRCGVVPQAPLVSQQWYQRWVSTKVRPTPRVELKVFLIECSGGKFHCEGRRYKCKCVRKKELPLERLRLITL